MATAILSASKAPAPVKGIPSTTTITPLRRRGAKEPADTLPAELPPGVWEALLDIQSELLKVKAMFACAYALAETNDDSSDVRWAMEAALELFESAVESVEPIMVKRAAAERGASDGR